MGDAASAADTAHVHEQLLKLRDKPAGNDQCSDQILQLVYVYLLNGRSSGAENHWFCSQANATTVEAATFLLRLFAYSSPQVEKWKEVLQGCLMNCSGCVLELEKVKITSRTTYFGAFTSNVLNNFWDQFNQWELQTVLERLSSLGVTLDSTSTSSIPSPIAYRMVTNLPIFRDARIQSMIHKHLSLQQYSDWPSDPIPPGVLALLMHDDQAVRRWASQQATRAGVIPISNEILTPLFKDVVNSVVSSLMSNYDGSNSAALVMTTVKDPVMLWKSFHEFVRFVHPDFLVSNGRNDIRHFTTSHLHDHGPELEHILRCFILILKRLNDRLWSGETPEYPQVVFDALKDNPSFTSLIQIEASSLEKTPWSLSWLSEYLYAIRSQSVYPEVLAKITEYLCGELQHERFGDARPTIMLYATKLLKSQVKNQSSTVADLMDIHADMFTAVLFAASHSEARWSNARGATRDLVHQALVRDTVNISDAITRLCRWQAYLELKKKQPEIEEKEKAPFRIREQIWKKMYSAFQSGDLDGLRSILSIVAQAAHLDYLSENSLSQILKVKLQGVKELIQAVNQALTVIRTGFLDAITKFTDYNVPTATLDVLQRDGTVKDVVRLMLSPVDVIRNGAQMLIGHAFDVDIRADCYRALIGKFPGHALDGMFEFLTTFVSYASTVPEACSLAKSLVRCFTDILEALCASPDGHLHKPQFLQSLHAGGLHTKLVALWKSMCKAMNVIFKRTPQWSPLFTPNVMIEWMRDALIFERDLLAHRTILETAVNTPSGGRHVSDPRNPSATGKRMIQDLHETLPELTRWLRLTDSELLHQSFTLLQSLLDCFREARIPPPEAGLKKIATTVKVAREGDPNKGSRLDDARLSKLEDAIASFEDEVEIQEIQVKAEKGKKKEKTHGVKQEDNDVEFVSMTKASQKPIITDKLMSKSKLKDEAKTQPSASNKVAPPSKVPVPATTKALKSSAYQFKSSDQEKLDAAHSLPKFRKTSTTTVQPSSARASSAPKSASSRAPSPSAVSDSSSDESEEESQRTTLAQLAKAQKSPKIKKQPERRGIKQIDIPTMTKNPMEERIRQREELRRKALRLRPDITGLHRELLSWNYDHPGAEPPGRKLSLLTVPDRFTDFNHYRRVFEPLLLLECWSQLANSKQERLDYFQCKIVSRQYTGDWSDLDISITEGVRKEWYLTENDVVLLRHPDGKTSFLGKTLNYRGTPTEIQASIRCLVPASIVDPLQLNSTWEIAKVFSLSTLHREFAALVSAEYYDCAQQVLNPQLSGIPKLDESTIKQTMERHSVNKPQATAIAASLRTGGFSLIQGPPGTGKTSTICGLVAAFLSDPPRRPVTINAGKPVEKPVSPKILICAPSNAAIDEIVGRLKDGIRGLTRKEGVLKVVRIGAEQAMSLNVKEVSLDRLVDIKLNSSGQQANTDIGNEIATVRRDLESVKQLRLQKIQEKNEVHDNSARLRALDDEIARLNSRRMTLTQQFDRLKDQQKAESRTIDASRRKARQEVLQEADVICSTLSGAGHEILEAFDFDMIIIDEAAQAIELSSLIPLKFRCDRCVMVGDPQQLPPTVLSRQACKLQYDQSLFVRLQKQKPEAVHLLSIQYRMHPDISRLPSKIFYDGRLQDGPAMDTKTAQPWHSSSKFGTYKFFNVAKGQEEKSGQSTKNRSECQIAVALFNRLRKEFYNIDFNLKIGIVSMYRAQIVEIRNTFQQRFGRDIVGQVDFNTVDGFQGQEKDIIILSCVRAGPGLTEIGFLSDVRRMNVAITRARSSLFILGHAPTLERSDEVWRNVIQDARSRGCLVEVDEAYFTAPSAILSGSSSPPKRQKPKKTQPVTAIPDDLTTPQQLKQSMEKKPSRTFDSKPEPSNPAGRDDKQGKRKREDSISTSTPAVPSFSTHLDKSSTDLPPPQRLKPESGDIQLPSSNRLLPPRPPPITENQVKMPPQKRPKPQPNIFLPKQKNKNKCPPDPNSEAGSSANRRRLA
uniref:Helicase sen1 n=1 Tax=Moniliophthora roreri TaxID=221103 RepID=A0A0W0F3J5_MONRR